MPDKALAKAGATMVKTWAVKNTGPTPWPQGCKLIFLRGDRDLLEEIEEFPIPLAEAGATVEVSALLKTPMKTGRASAYFSLATADRVCFGNRLWVDCTVEEANPADAHLFAKEEQEEKKQMEPTPEPLAVPVPIPVGNAIQVAVPVVSVPAGTPVDARASPSAPPVANQYWWKPLFGGNRQAQQPTSPPQKPQVSGSDLAQCYATQLDAIQKMGFGNNDELALSILE